MILWFRYCESLLRALTDSAFKGPTFRVTLLAASLDSSATIEPWLRFDDQTKQVIVLPPGSGVRFKKGWPVAGRAWQCPRLIFGMRLPKIDGPDQARVFFEGWGIAPATAQALSKSKSMLKVREVLCVGLPTKEPLVVSIDSFEEGRLILDVASGKPHVSIHRELTGILDQFIAGVSGEGGSGGADD